MCVSKAVTSSRIVRKNGKVEIQIVELGYPDKVIAIAKISKDDARFLVQELAKEIF